MSAPTITVSDKSTKLLEELSKHTGQTASEVVEKALKTYRRKVFFDQMNAGYAALRADPEAWSEHEAERKLWDATLMDGFEHWTEDGRVVPPEKEST